MAEHTSEAGQWIFEKRVFPHSIERKPKLAQHIRENVRTISLNGRAVDVIDFPKARAERFLLRITKGLLAHFYPDVAPALLEFETNQIRITAENRRAYEELRDSAAYDARGDSVFQFRRFVVKETGQGYWIYCFYGASLFSVRHKPRLSDQPAPSPEA